MATYDVKYDNGNNFENEFSSVALTAKAEIRPESNRGTTPAVLIGAGDVLSAEVVKANVIIDKIYLVVEEAMAGTVTVTVGATTVFPTLTAVTAVGATVSSTEGLYVTTPETISITFSDAQTAGQIKVAYSYLDLDTNTAKYIGS